MKETKGYEVEIVVRGGPFRSVGNREVVLVSAEVPVGDVLDAASAAAEAVRDAVRAAQAATPKK